MKAIDIARSAVIAPDATKSTTSLSPKRGGSCQFWAHADVNADSGIKNSLAKASASRSVSTGNSVALLSYSVGCSRMWPNSCAAVKIQRSTEIRSQVFTTTAGPPSSGPTLNPKNHRYYETPIEPQRLVAVGVVEGHHAAAVQAIPHSPRARLVTAAAEVVLAEGLDVVQQALDSGAVDGASRHSCTDQGCGAGTPKRSPAGCRACCAYSPAQESIMMETAVATERGYLGRLLCAAGGQVLGYI